MLCVTSHYPVAKCLLGALPWVLKHVAQGSQHTTGQIRSRRSISEVTECRMWWQSTSSHSVCERVFLLNNKISTKEPPATSAVNEKKWLLKAWISSATFWLFFLRRVSKIFLHSIVYFLGSNVFIYWHIYLSYSIFH